MPKKASSSRHKVKLKVIIVNGDELVVEQRKLKHFLLIITLKNEKLYYAKNQQNNL